MKTHGWVIVEPGGVPLWWAAYPTRADCIKRYTRSRVISWRELYRDGYRCVRCEVVK